MREDEGGFQAIRKLTKLTLPLPEDCNIAAAIRQNDPGVGLRKKEGAGAQRSRTQVHFGPGGQLPQGETLRQFETVSLMV